MRNLVNYWNSGDRGTCQHPAIVCSLENIFDPTNLHRFSWAHDPLVELLVVYENSKAVFIFLGCNHWSTPLRCPFHSFDYPSFFIRSSWLKNAGSKGRGTRRGYAIGNGFASGYGAILYLAFSFPRRSCRLLAYYFGTPGTFSTV